MGTCRTKRQQSGWRDLGLRITGDVMARETAHVAQALCPQCRLSIAWLLCPFQCQLRGDVVGVLLLHERCELGEYHASTVKLEPQVSPQRQIVLDSFGQWLHCTPPGQGSANVCKDTKSTLA